MSLSKEKSASSMFGINDCIKPKKNTKKSYTFNLTRKNVRRRSRRTATNKKKPYKIK